MHPVVVEGEVEQRCCGFGREPATRVPGMEAPADLADRRVLAQQLQHDVADDALVLDHQGQ